MHATHPIDPDVPRNAPDCPADGPQEAAAARDSGTFPTVRVCGWCGAQHPQRVSRRGLCSTCYRKARECGALPPRVALPGPPALVGDAAVEALVLRWPESTRAAVLRALLRRSP